uniref:Uncharacterized protein n=1 Tax=Caenorhabditis japonica TaxID=281687 RepID=A0A8R1IYE1_CAEJA
MDGLWLNGGSIGDADVRTMCETRLNEKQCARRANRDSCTFRVKLRCRRFKTIHGQCKRRKWSLSDEIT